MPDASRVAAQGALAKGAIAKLLVTIGVYDHPL